MITSAQQKILDGLETTEFIYAIFMWYLDNRMLVMRINKRI